MQTYRNYPIYLLILLVFSLLATSCKDNKRTEAAEVVTKNDNSTKAIESNSKTKNILCFGNSLTAGYGLDNEKDGWTFLLQDRIDSLGLDYRVINAGLSGETTAEGLARIDWVLSQKVDVFILELGANDMLRGLDVQSTRDNLDQIIAKVKEKNPNTKIVIAGMLAPPSMGMKYVVAFNAIFRDLSKKHNTRLIKFFLEGVAQRPSMNLPDGKHPNPEGQKIVLENVWKVLKTALN